MGKTRRLLSIGLLAFIALLVLITPILAATYYANINIAQSGGSNYTMLPIRTPLSTTWMIANNYFTSTGLDTRVLSNSTEQPHMLTDDKLFFAAPLNASSSATYRLTAGNTAASSFYTIPGYSGYVTTPDAGPGANLELGSSFTVTQRGYVDTSAGSNKNLIVKPLAFKTYVQAAGTIRSAILGSAAPANANYLSDGTGTSQAGYGALPAGNQFPASGSFYDKIDDPVGVPDDNTTYIYGTALTYAYAFFTLQDGTIPYDAVINTVTVYFRFNNSDGVNTSYVTPSLALGTDVTIGAEQSVVAGAGYTNYNEALARPGGGTWRGIDIPNLQFFFGLKTNNVATECRLTQGYAVVNYTSPTETVAVNATNVASGVHTIVTDDALTVDFADNGYIGVPHDATLSFAGDFSLEAWVRRDAAGDGWVITKGNGNDFFQNYGILAQAADTRFVIGNVANAGYYLLVTGTALTDDTWNHVACVLSGGNGYIYINGAPDANAAVAGVRTTNADEVRFGRRQDANNPLNGGITEVKIWNRALTATEVLQHAGGYYSSTSGLVGHWAIDEGAGVNIIDSAAGHNGTLNISAWGKTLIRIAIDNVVAAVNNLSAVPANGNDWLTMYVNAVPYMEYLKITTAVGGLSEKLWYQPISYIVGTALPDRDGADNNGTFTWGTNPTTVTASLGSLTSFSAPTDTGATANTPGVAGDINQPEGMFPTDEDISGTGLAWLYPTVRDIGTMTDTPIVEFWFLGCAIFVLGTIAVAFRFSQNLFGAGIIGLIAIGACVAMSFLPSWFIIIGVLIVTALATMERSPSV